MDQCLLSDAPRFSLRRSHRVSPSTGPKNSDSSRGSATSTVGAAPSPGESKPAYASGDRITVYAEAQTQGGAGSQVAVRSARSARKPPMGPIRRGPDFSTNDHRAWIAAFEAGLVPSGNVDRTINGRIVHHHALRRYYTRWNAAGRPPADEYVMEQPASRRKVARYAARDYAAWAQLFVDRERPFVGPEIVNGRSVPGPTLYSGYKKWLADGKPSPADFAASMVRRRTTHTFYTSDDVAAFVAKFQQGAALNTHDEYLINGKRVPGQTLIGYRRRWDQGEDVVGRARATEEAPVPHSSYTAEDRQAWNSYFAEYGPPARNTTHELNGKTVPGNTLYRHYRKWAAKLSRQSPSGKADTSVAKRARYASTEPAEPGAHRVETSDGGVTPDATGSMESAGTATAPASPRGVSMTKDDEALALRELFERWQSEP